MQYPVFGRLNPFLAGADPWQTGEVQATLELLEPEVGCEAVHGVRAQWPAQAVTYWIRGDGAVLRIDESPPGADGATIVSTLYSDILWNRPLPDHLFALAPPPRSEAARNVHEFLRSQFDAGSEVPAFEGVDLQGAPWRLHDHRGKVILLDFWSSGCGPCREVNRNLLDLHGRYGERGLEIVGISCDTDRDKLSAYLAEHPTPWPQLFDGQGLKGEIARLFQPRSFPTTVLLGRDGRIVSVGSRYWVLDDEIEQAVSGMTDDG